MAAGRLAKQSLSAAQHSFAEGAVNVGSIIIGEVRLTFRWPAGIWCSERGHMRGSCWAFSTVGSLEGRVAIAAGNLQQFSELQLVDCGKYFGVSDAKEA